MGWIISQALYEKWHCSQEQEEESSEDICSDGKQCALSNGSHTQLVYLSPDKMTAFSRLSRFGMMCKPLTADRGEDLLTLFRGDFLARTYPQQEMDQALQESDLECGRRWRGLLAKYDQNTHSLKTAQCSLFEDLTESCVTLPRWGMMLSGGLYLRQIAALHTGETESGLWPTPCATDYKGAGKNGELRDRLDYAVERGATKSNDYSMKVDREAGGQLNPAWVEWLMAFPVGWTDLKPLEMHKFQSWRQQHSISCETDNA